METEGLQRDGSDLYAVPLEITMVVEELTALPPPRLVTMAVMTGLSASEIMAPKTLGGGLSLPMVCLLARALQHENRPGTLKPAGPTGTLG